MYEAGCGGDELLPVLCWLAAGQQVAAASALSLPLLGAGMTEMSNLLSQDAKQFAVKAKDLYHQVHRRACCSWSQRGVGPWQC